MASVSGEKERPYPHPWHPITWCIYAATQPFSGQDWLEASLSQEEEYYSAQQVHSEHPLWEALGDNDRLPVPALQEIRAQETGSALSVYSIVRFKWDKRAAIFWKWKYGYCC